MQASYMRLVYGLCKVKHLYINNLWDIDYFQELFIYLAKAIEFHIFQKTFASIELWS